MTAIRRLSVAAAVALGVVAVVPAAMAASEQDRAVELLQRAARAATTIAYSGVQYVTVWTDQGATSVVADVRHTPGVGLLVKVRDTPRAAGVQVVDPDNDDLTAPSSAEVQLLERHYRLALEMPQRADGRVADVVAVRRSDDSVAGRFWLDAQSGLVLRRELLDREGRLLRATAFVDVSLAPAPATMTAPVAAKRMPSAWGTRVDPVADRTRLTRMGFHVPQSLPGGYQLFDARLSRDQGSRQVLHLTYSDGLSTVSLFQQRGRLDSAALGSGWQRTKAAGATVWVRGGLPARATWSGRGTVYTVLADADPDSVTSVVAALPHTQPRPGLWARIGKGLSRMLSWLNPFA